MVTASKSPRTTRAPQAQTRSVGKSAIKSSVPPAAPPKSAEAGKPAVEEKPKKTKLVRDSFTIPKAEYAVLDALKQRAAKMGTPAKKSELLRAGIKLLAGATDTALAAALAAVPAIKTGRPAKG